MVVRSQPMLVERPNQRPADSFLWKVGCALAFLPAIAPAGCKSGPPPAPPGPAESLVFHGDKLEQVSYTKADSESRKLLAGAHELFRQKQYNEAEKLFTKIADNKHNGEQVAEEARFYAAEALYRQKKYPKAADTYNQLLTDFPSGAHREPAMKRMFDIANYWLDDTREEMRREREARDGKKLSFEWPTVVHFEETKPFVDERGRAVEKLEQVVYNDLQGPLADEALFLAGSVKFYERDYREADHYFSQLVQFHPNSKFAPKATELAIVAKRMSTGGPDYDARKAAESRNLIFKAQDQYPELAATKSDFLSRQLASVTMLQAQKDFEVAEFYRRTDHPGAAYFYYDIVRRRYPATPYAPKATQHMQELAVEQDKKRAAEKVKPVVAQAELPAKPAPTTTPRAPLGTQRLPPQPEVAPPPRPFPTPTTMPSLQQPTGQTGGGS
jgi:outer membrane protein assembly factor BamD (BamD/ComL family)